MGQYPFSVFHEAYSLLATLTLDSTCTIQHMLRLLIPTPLQDRERGGIDLATEQGQELLIPDVVQLKKLLEPRPVLPPLTLTLPPSTLDCRDHEVLPRVVIADELKHL